MKFRLKITLCMLGLLSLLFGVGGSLLIALSFHNSLEREQTAAYNAYQMVLGTLEIVSVNGQLDQKVISRALEQLAGQNVGSWTALRLYTATQVIYEDGASGLAYPAEPSLPGSCAIRYESTDQSKPALLLTGALQAGGETLYLDMACDIAPLFAARRAQQQTYQWVFLLLVGLCALLSYSTARVLTYPLASLSRASRALATGQYACRARIYSGDEIGLVARDFNAMAANLEAKISDLKAAMERQERFMGSFAHEVKTPLTSIIGYADLIRGQMLSAEEQSQAANYIVFEGKRLENLSQKLLEIFVVQQGTFVLSPARPASLIQGLAAHLEPLYAQQGVILTCDCEDGVCLLEADLVRSLLVNLWDNARKALDQRPGHIAVRGEMLPDGCRITVRDNGRGIPPAALEHLTEAFYRVDKSRSRQQGGVGLGLALCQEIVSLHHGSMRFFSQVGRGTTVIVELKGGAA